MNKYRLVASIATSIVMAISPASAVENGILLTHDENAVYLLDGSVNAFLYKPQIVFTSAHGVDQWAKGELFVNSSSGKRSRVERIILAKGFKDRVVTRESIASGNSIASRSNDFAIIILKDPLPMTQKVDLIKSNELSSIISNQEPVYSIGYSSYDNTRKKDQRPRQLEAKMIEKELAKTIYEKYYSMGHPHLWPRGATFELIDIQVVHSPTKGSGCDGDSGSGYFIKRGDTKVYLGPAGAHAAGMPNCGQPGFWGEFGNAFAIEPVYKHLDLIREAELIVSSMNPKPVEPKVEPTPTATPKPVEPKAGTEKKYNRRWIGSDRYTRLLMC